MVYYYRTRNQLDDFVIFISRANIFDPRSHYQEMDVVSVVDKILLGYTQVFLRNTKYKLIQIYPSHVNEKECISYFISILNILLHTLKYTLRSKIYKK